MAQYTEFWKTYLDEIKSEFKDFDQPFEHKKENSGVENLGKRTSTGYHGSLELFACQVKKIKDNSVYRNLAEVLKKDSRFRNKLTGLLKISIDQSSTIHFEYQPFSIEMMMNRYRDYQDKNGMADELYKWEVIKQGHEAFKKYKAGETSFEKFFSQIPWKNLISTFTQPVWKTTLEKFPKEMETAFELLHDEKYDHERNALQKRLEGFKAEMERLHQQLNDSRFKNSGLEERAYATLLTLIDPTKYTFYIDSFYSNLARCITDGPKPAGQKLVHYYDLTEDFIHGPLNDYEDVISIKNRSIEDDKYYKDVDNRLLAQDIFYVTLMKDNYNPKKTSEIEEVEDLTSDEEKELLESLQASSTQEVKDYFNILDKIKEGIDLNEFEKITFSCKRASLNMIVGQRYSWNLMSWKKANQRFGFISHQKAGNDSSLYDGDLKNYYSYDSTTGLAESNLKSIVKGIQTELGRTNKSSFKEHENSLFREIVFDKQLRAEYFAKYLSEEISEPVSIMQNPINKILYGPPGTGKTFTLKNEYFKHYEERETSISPEQNFKQVAKDLTWWQAVGLALIDNGGKAKVAQIKENRWMKVVAEQSNSQNINASIWGNLQYHTVEESTTVNFKRRLPPFIFDKRENSTWEILMDNVNEQCPELLEFKEKVDHFQPKSDKIISRYVFTTFHQAFAYEDFIEGIKPVMAEETDGELSYTIEDGVFKRVCKRAEQDPENQYAIFIDEINRGNIANIFGELITLIEKDKRKGMSQAMSVTLPYSKAQFSVPANLDIYGTMNTADRSIEALDSALRRRFVFEELMPDPELIKIRYKGIAIKDVLLTINERIEVLIDRDHQIGHAYFLKVDPNSAEDAIEYQLKSVFSDEIIPLLQEYFYNDYVKIGMVLGDHFVQATSVKTSNFSSILGSVAADYSEHIMYKINPQIKSEKFDLTSALKRLLNIKSDDQAS